MSEQYKPVVLIIRDGWGENHDASYDAYNAVKLANTPVADKLTAEWPRTEIQACGLAVGLPEGIMGNSEVGHQNIGAGRVVDQEIVRINKGIATGTVKDSPALQQAFENVKQRGSALHFMGLVSDAGVHSMLDHLYGLLAIAKEQGIAKVYLHAFTDGRDTGPFTGKTFIEQAESKMAEIGIGQIATVAGRYWAMDRDNRWDRVQRAYDCLTGRRIEKTYPSASEAIQAQYDAPETEGTKGDEFCPPSAVVDADGHPVAKIQNGDSVIFFNFRGDRPRELTRAFIEDDFDAFDRGEKLDLFFATLSQYQKGLCPNVIFQKPAKMDGILGAYLAEKSIPQFRCAETEKFPHVTFFFNDYREEPFPGEDRELVPSRKDCATYDEKPEMSAYGIRDAAVKAIQSGKYGLVVVNFANPDMVGHTGNIEATIKAIKAIDHCLEEIIMEALNLNINVLITGDHGNAEQKINPQTGGISTEHTANLVPFIFVNQKFQQKKIKISTGILGDVAPTVLALLNIKKPDQMTGRNLLEEMNTS